MNRNMKHLEATMDIWVLEKLHEEYRESETLTEEQVARWRNTVRKVPMKRIQRWWLLRAYDRKLERKKSD